MNNPGNRGAYSEAIQSNAGKGRNSANFALITFERCFKMTHFVYHLRTNARNRQLYSDCRVFPEGGGGGGGGGGCGIDHVSWKIKWPFHISRTINSAFHVSREKNVLYDPFCLFWLRTTAKELPCSMFPPFCRFLFLVL